jgi:hypothetical protein
MPSLVPLYAFATDIFPKLQADITERVNLLRFAKLAPTFSNNARSELRRFTSRLVHGALALLTSDPPTSSRLGELRDKFHEHYDAVFCVAVCRIFGLFSSPILSTLRSPTDCVLAISRFKLYGVRSRRRVLTCRITRGSLLYSPFGSMQRDASVQTAQSSSMTPLAKIISEVHGALGVGVEVLTYPMMLVLLPNGNDDLPVDVGVLHYHDIRGSKLALDAVVPSLFNASSPPSPDVALHRAEKTKFEKYTGGVRNRPDIRPDAPTSFCSHGILYSRRPRHEMK